MAKSIRHDDQIELPVDQIVFEPNTQLYLRLYPNLRVSLSHRSDKAWQPCQRAQLRDSNAQISSKYLVVHKGAFERVILQKYSPCLVYHLTGLKRGSSCPSRSIKKRETEPFF
ncbi:hypothetical protein AR540_23930 [Pseudomonas sp. EpS/L25]|nr:hypothetical protein AR540_23930 [Pseudomonas sp. EpS/L25]